MTDHRYLLDANILSSLIRDPVGPIYRKIAGVGPEQICTSIIVACELRFGAAKSKSDRIRDRIEGTLARVDVLPFDGEADRHYGRIRAALEAEGRPIGANDLFIAAHALSLGLTLVTHNTREFDRVPGLVVEDWLA